MLDFSEDLLLPRVGIAEARCYLSGTFTTAFSTEINGLKVGVKLASAVASEAPATVMCDVDQSQRSCAAH